MNKKALSFGLVSSLLFLLCGVLESYAQDQSYGFSVENGVIYSSEGIPEVPRWFADDRLAFQMDDEGVQEIGYYVEGGGAIFRQHLWSGFRYYLEKDGLNYAPGYKENRIWPFGVESSWELMGNSISHKIMAVDERLVFEITTPEDMEEGYRIRFDFNTTYGFSYSDKNDYRYPSAPNREWKSWEFDKKQNVLKGGYIVSKPAVKKVATEVIGLEPMAFDAEHKEAGEDELVAAAPVEQGISVVIGADFDISYETGIKKMIPTLLSQELKAGKTYRIIVNFGSKEEEALKKNTEFLRMPGIRTQAQFDRYTDLGESIPKLNSGNKSLDRLFQLMPMYHEAMKITDIPGAIRAKTWYYWVWGWDGMTMNNATAYWGDTEFLKEMLGFYYKTSHPEMGIAHMFNYDLTVAEFSPLPAQAMYIVLLQMYYDHTSDSKTLIEYYPFAKQIFNRAAEQQVGETGLIKGTSLFPDFRKLVGETGNDISGFNNSIFYSSARSFNRLAAIMQDGESEKVSMEIIKNTEANFLEKFSSDRGYIHSSVDASSFEKRDIYQTSSMRWENKYLYELVEPILENSMDFYEKNFISASGLRIVPKWNSAYGADENQLLGWWPINDEAFTRMTNLTNRPDLLEKWTGWLSYWGDLLSCPEAVSVHVETDKPKPDNWNSLKGSWQAFSIRPWYQGIVHSLVGVDADAGGITFYPYSGKEMSLKGLHFDGRSFDIEMKGSGPYVNYIQVGENKIAGTNILPREYYSADKHIKLSVHRTKETPHKYIIKQGTGISIEEYSFSRGRINARIKGAGFSRLILNAVKEPSVSLDGEKLPVKWDSVKQLAFIELELDYGKEYALTIK